MKQIFLTCLLASVLAVKLSEDPLVSAIVGVAPVTVERHLDALGVAHVDYFCFLMESESLVLS